MPVPQLQSLNSKAEFHFVGTWSLRNNTKPVQGIFYFIQLHGIEFFTETMR